MRDPHTVALYPRPNVTVPDPSIARDVWDIVCICAGALLWTIIVILVMA